MSDLKSKQIFDQPVTGADLEIELTAQQHFDESPKFTPMVSEQELPESNVEKQLEQVIRPKKRRGVLIGGLITAFAGLIGWQAIDSVVVAAQGGDWLALGWAGFITVISSLGIGAIGKELWKLRRLRHHFSDQEQAQQLMSEQGVGKGKTFCENLAKQAGVLEESPSYDRWRNSIMATHSDAEVLDMYDAMVVAEQDKQATRIVSQHATEAAALVAISPLAVADMLLVAWRNFKMIDNLSEIYGIELGYWSRLSLFKSVLINMAAAGASELAIDAGMDLMSMDLAGKVSARAGQGLGIGILTARLGLKSMSLLRPTPWHEDRAVKLGAIRKQIVAKVAALTVK